MRTRDLDLAPPPTLSPSEKLRIAVEMADLGIAMKRRSLVRDHPSADPTAIDALLWQWLAAPR